MCHALLRNRSRADQSVFRLKEYLEIARNIVCDQGRNPDAEIDEVAGAKFERHASRNDRLSIHGLPVDDEIIDERCWGHDMVGRYDTDWNDMLGCDNDRIGCHGHDRIEVAGRQRIGEIAEVVGQKRVDQRKIRAKSRLEQEALAVDLDLALAFLDNRADAGCRQHASKAATAGPNALDKRALRHKIDRQLIGPDLLLSVS